MYLIYCEVTNEFWEGQFILNFNFVKKKMLKALFLFQPSLRQRLPSPTDNGKIFIIIFIFLQKIAPIYIKWQHMNNLTLEKHS